ncbi:MAG: hypothetical protein PWQ48_1078 [Thermotogaceae bacterium]|jgi:predicted phosphodiesterase|nr:hypothetical protein [Thermotogaceae bacterium]
MVLSFSKQHNLKEVILLKKILILVVFLLFFSQSYSDSVPTFMKLNDNVIKIIEGRFSHVDLEGLPFSTPDSTFSCIIYGDSRWGDRTHEKLVTLMLEFDPDIVVHLGDMVNNGCDENDWEKFYTITVPLRKSSFFQIVKGNHEKPDTCFEKHFNLHNYYATFSDVRFVFLDLELGIDRAEEFLREVATDKTIIFIHYPVFTAGPHMTDSIVRKARRLHDVFKELGIKVVFSSHDHNYQRFRKEGILYVVTGGGGAALYDIINKFEPLVYNKIHHFVYIEYNGIWIKAKVIDESGNSIDEFSIYF